MLPAKRISPPASTIVEKTSDDGILLLVTEEAFTSDNPKHVAVADEIQDTLEPLQDDGKRWREAKVRMS